MKNSKKKLKCFDYWMLNACFHTLTLLQYDFEIQKLFEEVITRFQKKLEEGVEGVTILTINFFNSS